MGLCDALQLCHVYALVHIIYFPHLMSAILLLFDFGRLYCSLWPLCRLMYVKRFNVGAQYFNVNVDFTFLSVSRLFVYCNVKSSRPYVWNCSLVLNRSAVFVVVVFLSSSITHNVAHHHEQNSLHRIHACKMQGDMLHQRYLKTDGCRPMCVCVCVCAYLRQTGLVSLGRQPV